MKRKCISVVILLVIIIQNITTNVKAVNSSVFTYTSGIDGQGNQPIEKVKFKDDESDSYVLAGENGLYVYKDGNNQFYESKGSVESFLVVEDQNGDSIRDILIYQDSGSAFDNLVLISGSDMSLIWSRRMTKVAYTDGIGWSEENRFIYSLTTFTSQFALIISDYQIFSIDLSSGNIDYQLEDLDNIWDIEILDDQNGDGISEFAYANQIGDVAVVDGKKGNILWKTKIVESIDVLSMYDSKRLEVTFNVWDLTYIDQSLYAITETGNLVQLDPNNGTIINQIDLELVSLESLLSFYQNNVAWNNDGNQKVLPSGLSSQYFKSMQFIQISDHQIGITAYLGSPIDFTNPNGYDDSYLTLSGTKPTVIIYNTETQSIEKNFNIDNYQLDYTLPLFTTYQDQAVMLIPLMSGESTLKVGIYSMDTTEYITNIDIAISKKNSDNTDGKHRVLISDFGDQYVIQEFGRCSLNSTKDFKTINNIGNFSSGKKLYEDDSSFIVGYLTNDKMDRIVRYGLNKEEDVIWEYQLPDEFKTNSNGFESMSLVLDVNNDGQNDFGGLITVSNDKGEKTASWIVILDFNQGGVLKLEPVISGKALDEFNKSYTTYLVAESLKVIKDLNNDGKNEMMLDRYVVDGNKLSLKNDWSIYLEESGTPFEVGDINGDGIGDIVLVNDKFARIYLSKLSNYDLVYTKSSIKIDLDAVYENSVNAKMIDDRDGDGINELIINVKNSSGLQSYRVYNSKTLTAMYDLLPDGVYNAGEAFQFLDIDVDNDGYLDIFLTNYYDLNQVINGRTGEVMVSFSRFDYEYDSYVYEYYPANDGFVSMSVIDKDEALPFAVVSDQNGDDKQDLIINYCLYTSYAVESHLSLFDLTQGVEISDITLISVSYGNYQYSNEQQTIIAVGNSNDLLYFIQTIEGKATLYDFSANEVIADYDLKLSSAKLINEEKIIATNKENTMMMIDYSRDFELLNIEDGQVISSPYTVEWEIPEGISMMQIKDNSTTIVVSSTNQASIQLLEGEHTLTFKLEDQWGKQMYKQLSIQVKKRSSKKPLIIIYGLLSIITLLALVFYPTYRRNKMMKGVKQ